MNKLVLFRKQIELLTISIKYLEQNTSNDFFKIRDAFFDLFYESQYNLKSEIIEIIPVENLSAIRHTIDCLKNASSISKDEVFSLTGNIKTKNVIQNISYLIKLLQKAQNDLSNHAVFYSWQSDRLTSINRNFIENCILKAISKLNAELPYKLFLDKDTRNVPGSPNIPDVIANKIDNSFCFIGDVTLTNKDSKKPSPNPNVMFETEYALSSLGDKRLIVICNTHYGELEQLPFDIRIRRIMQYELARNTPQKEKEEKKEKLISCLYDALKAISNL